MNRRTYIRVAAWILAVLCLTGCGRRGAARREAFREQKAAQETWGPQTTEPDESRKMVPEDAESQKLQEHMKTVAKSFGTESHKTTANGKSKQWQSYSDVNFQTVPPSADLEPETEPDSATDSGPESGLPQVETTRGSYWAGNCKKLEGNPYVLTIFLDDDESRWSEEEVLNALWYQVNPGLEFIEQEAAKWGVYLDFQQGYFATYGHPDRPVRYNGVVGNFLNGSTSNDILDQAALSLGYTSRENMHDSIREFSGQDQVLYMFMLNKPGRSYASSYRRASTLPYETQGQDTYFLESNVIFTGFTWDYADTGPDTIAHETLHPFGAEDYYMPDARYALAQQYYATDIMTCHMPDLSSFTLGDVTAYCVGWTDDIPAICYDPGWWEGFE